MTLFQKSLSSGILQVHLAISLSEVVECYFPGKIGNCVESFPYLNTSSHRSMMNSKLFLTDIDGQQQLFL